MSACALILAAAMAAPAAAQDAAPPDTGALLEQLGRSASEALEALGALTGAWAEGLGPVLADPNAFEPPEILPNGDILIRRKPAPPSAEPTPGPGDAPPIDL
jgi:hypothetical protein